MESGVVESRGDLADTASNTSHKVAFHKCGRLAVTAFRCTGTNRFIKGKNRFRLDSHTIQSRDRLSNIVSLGIRPIRQTRAVCTKLRLKGTVRPKRSA
jgi:hypothetical protein